MADIIGADGKTWMKRFWDKADVSGGRDSCWPWTAATFENGYGAFKFKCEDGVWRQRKASRVAYELTAGPIPHGACVLHRCDNPPCVNPAHLFVGSHADNLRDCADKGRRVQVRGETHGHSKLTDTAVREIRRQYSLGGISQARLGEKFGVGLCAVHRIVRGTGWKHLYDNPTVTA